MLADNAKRENVCSVIGQEKKNKELVFLFREHSSKHLKVLELEQILSVEVELMACHLNPRGNSLVAVKVEAGDCFQHYALGCWLDEGTPEVPSSLSL